MTSAGTASALDRLAELVGIERAHRDYFGNETIVSVETKRALLRALGFAVDSAGELASSLRVFEERSRRRALAPVSILPSDGRFRVPIALELGSRDRLCEWHLREESGRSHHGRAAVTADEGEEQASDGRRSMRGEFEIDVALPFGYHDLTVEGLGDTVIIVAPRRCYLPQAEADGERTWALALQLYALRSRRNWGAGDFTDLAEIARLTANCGGAAVAVNPFHELDPADPLAASPYSPSSRLHLNVAALDVEAIPDFAECPAARRLVQAPAFAGRLRALRDAALVDYEAVAACKRAILDELFGSFRLRHLVRKSARGRAFEAFVAAGGTVLRKLATFEALREHFREPPSAFGWPAWPAAFRDCDSAAVEDFAAHHEERLAFFSFLQWNADLQLAAAAKACAGMPIGLFRDLAVGSAATGAEAWSDRAALVHEVTLGAPADPLNVLGQSWGLAPQNPLTLVERAYAPFAALIRANMRYAGALRIDHVMGLQRQFWIPAGRPPREGAYVRFPLADLLAIVALESRRNACVVVGEDLGTVPEGFREHARSAGLLSCRLLYFEHDAEGAVAPPQHYPRAAVASPGTHDLPTLPAYWTGQDLRLRADIGLLPPSQSLEDALSRRAKERSAFLDAFVAAGVLAPDAASRLRGTGETAAPEDLRAFVAAAYAYLAQSEAFIVSASLDDMLGSRLQVNVPGTMTEHPNWQHKAGVALEDLPHHLGFIAVVDVLRAPSARKPPASERS